MGHRARIINRSSETLTWDNLQQQHEFESIPEVFLNVLDLCPCLTQVRVAPGSEGLRGNKYNIGHIELHLYYIYTSIYIESYRKAYNRISKQNKMVLWSHLSPHLKYLRWHFVFWWHFFLEQRLISDPERHRVGSISSVDCICLTGSPSVREKGKESD